MKKRLLTITFVILANLCFLGCFEIIHYLEKSSENSAKVVWSFSISSDFTGGNKQFPVPGQKEDSLEDRISKSEKEIEEKLKGVVSDLKVDEIENEFEKGTRISFLIKDIKKTTPLTDSKEGFPLIPRFDDKKNQLIFTFLPASTNQKKSEEKIQKIPQTHPKNTDEYYPEDHLEPNFEEISDTPKSVDPGFEKIATQFMSFATYKLLLGRGFRPRSVEVIGKSSNQKTKLPFIKLGNMYMIKIPFMTFLIKEKVGFDVVVQL
ncbi:MAG: hypothetical protein H7A23_23240 [Leptospiraceae bacterium]|nr:hypothetical protein [Leptospiraceae bacterium]